MRSKKELESEIQGMKEQIERINNATANSLNVEEILKEKSKSDEVGSNMLALFKYVMDENRKTNIILKEMYGKLERMESDLDADYYEQDDQAHLQENNRFAKVQPVSGLDAKIMQIIQISGMACADDIKKQMNYNGRNAASARLNKLHKLGLLERYQLGHKVYYKYDAGKTTNTLIVSPPQ
jgi:hypothetical protein